MQLLSPLGPGLLSPLGPGRRWGLEPRGVAAPRKPFNVDVVHLGKMLFENPSGFEFVLAYTELVGKMLFEMAAHFELVLAQEA